MDPLLLAYILMAVGVVLVIAELFVPTGFILVVIGACCALVGHIPRSAGGNRSVAQSAAAAIRPYAEVTPVWDRKKSPAAR